MTHISREDVPRLVRQLRAMLNQEPKDFSYIEMQAIADAATALVAAPAERAAIVEECAKIAEQHDANAGGLGHIIAIAIRSLAGGTPGPQLFTDYQGNNPEPRADAQ